MAVVWHQMSAQAEREMAGHGEAASQVSSDETTAPQSTAADAGLALLEQMLARGNMQRAWQRVKANKGAAGVDGFGIAETQEWLKTAWPVIREQLRQRCYVPHPVRRVGIPKADGSVRELGIPTVTDRLIQQALLQMLQPLLDSTFSAHSHGFRPGRRAQDAVLAAQRHVQAGYCVVVDVDLSKFFDRVNHDILMDRLRKRTGDSDILWLIRAYLNAGIMHNGVVWEREQGTPQGGPLSPLLANVLLDEVDKKLEARGHRFERYADDCNVYVRSQKAGERVMTLLKRSYAKLRLQINESKSAVASVFGRKFLGYSFWMAKGGVVKCAVAKKAIATFKQKVRQLTRRSCGRSIAEIIERLRRYVLGWKAYFKLAQTPKVWHELDKWMRHRMRAIQLKQWRRGKTMYRELRALGAAEWKAREVAANSHCWWRNSRMTLNGILTIAYFDRLGMPRLS